MHVLDDVELDDLYKEVGFLVRIPLNEVNTII
jgi:hypothetical protein